MEHVGTQPLVSNPTTITELPLSNEEINAQLQQLGLKAPLEGEVMEEFMAELRVAYQQELDAFLSEQQQQQHLDNSATADDLIRELEKSAVSIGGGGAGSKVATKSRRSLAPIQKSTLSRKPVPTAVIPSLPGKAKPHSITSFTSSASFSSKAVPKSKLGGKISSSTRSVPSLARIDSRWDHEEEIQRPNPQQLNATLTAKEDSSFDPYAYYDDDFEPISEDERPEADLTFEEISGSGPVQQPTRRPDSVSMISGKIANMDLVSVKRKIKVQQEKSSSLYPSYPQPHEHPSFMIDEESGKEEEEGPKGKVMSSKGIRKGSSASALIPIVTAVKSKSSSSFQKVNGPTKAKIVHSHSVPLRQDESAGYSFVQDNDEDRIQAYLAEEEDYPILSRTSSSLARIAIPPPPPRRKHDPVRRFHALNAQWTSNPFLKRNETDARRNLAGFVGGSAMLSASLRMHHHGGSSSGVGTYVNGADAWLSHKKRGGLRKCTF